MQIGDLELEPLGLQAMRSGRLLDLTTQEFALLSLLVQRAGEVVPRTLIAERVWQSDFRSTTNNVSVLVQRMRAKVDEPFFPKLIHTMRGAGYFLKQLNELE